MGIQKSKEGVGIAINTDRARYIIGGAQRQYSQWNVSVPHPPKDLSDRPVASGDY
jgi:hypothetical protein